MLCRINRKSLRLIAVVSFHGVMSCTLAFGQSSVNPVCEIARRDRICKELVDRGNGSKLAIRELFGQEYLYKTVKSDDSPDAAKEIVARIGPSVDQCLMEMLACNENVEVASRLVDAMKNSSGEGEEKNLPTTLPTNQQFVLGVAFFRLHLETRSDVLRCAYGSRSKSQLRDFLIQARQHVDKDGSPTSLDISRVQGAINMMKVLEAPNSCPENPLTLGEIASVVREFTADHVVKVFTEMTSETSQDTVSGRLKAIYAVVQQYINSVVEVENAVQLLDVEMVANANKMRSVVDGPIRNIYCKNPDDKACQTAVSAQYGTIPPYPLLSIEVNEENPPALAAAHAKNSDLAEGRQQIQTVQSALTRLISSAYACYVQHNPTACSAQSSDSADEAYEQLRLRLTSETYYWAEQATRQDAILRGLLTGDGTSETSFRSLVRILDEREAELPDNPLNVVGAVQKSFEDKLSKEVCGTTLYWFCCKAAKARNKTLPYCAN